MLWDKYKCMDGRHRMQRVEGLGPDEPGGRKAGKLRKDRRFEIALRYSKLRQREDFIPLVN